MRILVPTGHVQVVMSSGWPVVRGCIFAPSFLWGLFLDLKIAPIIGGRVLMTNVKSYLVWIPQKPRKLKISPPPSYHSGHEQKNIWLGLSDKQLLDSILKKHLGTKVPPQMFQMK